LRIGLEDRWTTGGNAMPHARIEFSIEQRAGRFRIGKAAGDAINR
jgi:hypothetical protein